MAHPPSVLSFFCFMNHDAALVSPRTLRDTQETKLRNHTIEDGKGINNKDIDDLI